MKRVFLASCLWVACGHGQPAPATPEPAQTFQPCALDAVTLMLPIGETFALAAGDGACLWVDEAQEAAFISIAELHEDEEGYAVLHDDIRAFLRASGLLGEAPAFTGRRRVLVLTQDVEAHTFVATPPGLPERAGFAFSVPITNGALLFLGLGATPRAAADLQERLVETMHRAAPSAD